MTIAATAGRMRGSSVNSAEITARTGAALRTPAIAPALVFRRAGPGARDAPNTIASVISVNAAARKEPLSRTTSSKPAMKTHASTLRNEAVEISDAGRVSASAVGADVARATTPIENGTIWDATIRRMSGAIAIDRSSTPSRAFDRMNAPEQARDRAVHHAVPVARGASTSSGSLPARRSSIAFLSCTFAHSSASASVDLVFVMVGQCLASSALSPM